MPGWPDTFLLATSNAGKADELGAMLAAHGITATIKTYADFGLKAPEETGTTFLENCLIKARAGFAATGLPCLADDSGLCVTALDDAPGVYTADWAEQPDGTRNYHSAMAFIDAKLAGQSDRRAAFVCTLVFIDKAGVETTAEGRVTGILLSDAQGSGGHGYDPWFVPEGYSDSFGTLSAEVKNSLSHRGKAFENLIAKRA